MSGDGGRAASHDASRPAAPPFQPRRLRLRGSGRICP